MTTETPDLPHRRHPGWAWLVAGHAAVVALVVAALIHVSPDGGGGANFGAGLLMMPLWLLGLPWWAALMFIPRVPGDLAIVAAALINVGLHAGLDARLRRRAPWPPLAVTALLVALPVVLVGLVWGHTRQATDDLRRPIVAAVPAEMWRIDPADLGDPGCAFCVPDSLSWQADRLVRPGATEAQLLAAVDAHLTAGGYRPDHGWTCDDLTDAAPDRRLCARGWSGPGFGTFVRVYFRSDGRDTQLWIDVNRDR